MVLLDVPMHRRLEVFSVGFVAFCEVVLGPLCCFLVPLIIVITKSLILDWHLELNSQSKLNYSDRLNVSFSYPINFIVLWEYLPESSHFAVFSIHLLWPTYGRPRRTRFWVIYQHFIQELTQIVFKKTFLKIDGQILNQIIFQNCMGETALGMEALSKLLSNRFSENSWFATRSQLFDLCIPSWLAQVTSFG